MTNITQAPKAKLFKPLRFTPALKIRLKKITLLALPSGANSFLDILNIAMALFFISSLGDLHIVAIGISLNFLMLFFAINAIFYIGTNAQISRYYGAKEYKKTNEVFLSLFIFGFLISLPLIWVGKYFAGSFFDFLGVSKATKELALQYIHFVIFTIPALNLKNIITSSLAALGDTLHPFLVRIFSTLICIFLHYILIFGIKPLDFKGYGIIGAGVANLLSAYIELCVLLLLVKGNLFSHFKIHFSYFIKALKIGIPAGIERFLTLFSLIITTKFITHFGDLALAGAQIGTRIEAFSFMPGFGFMVAAMVLMGQNLGARKIPLCALYIRTILIFSSLVLGVLGVILAIFAKNFSLIFSSESEVVKTSIYYLLAVGFSQIPMICSFVLDGALRGAGITKATLAINACSIWCFRILPMAIVVWLNAGVGWLFFMIFFETYIRAFIFYSVFKTGIWKRSGSEI